jgi:hypothetical protein
MAQGENFGSNNFRNWTLSLIIYLYPTEKYPTSPQYYF